MKKNAIVIGIIALLLFICLTVWSNKVNAAIKDVSPGIQLKMAIVQMPTGHEGFKFGTHYSNMPPFKQCWPAGENTVECIKIVDKTFHGFKISANYRFHKGKFVAVKISFLADDDSTTPYKFAGKTGTEVVQAIRDVFGPTTKEFPKRAILIWQKQGVRIEWYTGNNILYIANEDYTKYLINKSIEGQIKRKKEESKNEEKQKNKPTSGKREGGVSGHEFE